jgi:hypothetical protein
MLLKLRVSEEETEFCRNVDFEELKKYKGVKPCT